MRTPYFLISWVDPSRPSKGTREYGTSGSKQAAINRAARVLPPGTDYIVRTVHSTVHEGQTNNRKEHSERQGV